MKKALAGGALALSLVFGGSMTAGAVAPAPKLVLAGQFCKNADAGKVVKADNGVMVRCQMQGGRNHWVVK